MATTEKRREDDGVKKKNSSRVGSACVTGCRAQRAAGGVKRTEDGQTRPRPQPRTETDRGFCAAADARSVRVLPAYLHKGSRVRHSQLRRLALERGDELLTQRTKGCWRAETAANSASVQSLSISIELNVSESIQSA
jgi:hypothetical protein